MSNQSYNEIWLSYNEIWLSHNEIWYKCAAPYTRYEVSNMGRIRNYKGKILNQKRDYNGYMSITLSNKNCRQTLFVHRLVALAFCDGYLKGLDVDHINGQRSDNRAINLRWITPSENRSNNSKGKPVLYFKEGATAPIGIYSSLVGLKRVEGGRPEIHLKHGMKFHGGRIQPITREQYNKIIELMQQHWTLKSAWVEVMTELNL